MAAPPPAGTATARKVSSSAAPARGAPERGSRRAPLRVIRPEGGRGARRGRDRGRLLTVLSIALVVGSLLVVVIGQAMLANGQVRMASLQHALTAEQSQHRENEAAVSLLEQPYRIVSTATNTLHLVHVAAIELPYVSLKTPLPTPNVTSAPAPPAVSTTTAASGQ